MPVARNPYIQINVHRRGICSPKQRTLSSAPLNSLNRLDFGRSPSSANTLFVEGVPDVPDYFVRSWIQDAAQKIAHCRYRVSLMDLTDPKKPSSCEIRRGIADRSVDGTRVRTVSSRSAH